MGFFASLFKSYSEKQIKKIMPAVDKIEALADKYAAMSDEQMRECTVLFKKRLAEGETLDDILPEAFALVREADDRVLGKRPFRVQLMGGILLHQGRIAEMKTGEGKTLVATLPAYLNALAGKGVHIVTVNEYLARRDSEEMGKVFRFLGLTVGLVVRDMTHEEKVEAYAADITYGMNSEFGFDYLRDNLAVYKEQLTARGYDFAIIDEVDSILIDEAKTPLIISSMSDKATGMYQRTDRLVRTMRPMILADTDTKEDYNSFEEHFGYDEESGNRTVLKKSAERFAKVFSLDLSSDFISTADYGITVTAEGMDKLISGFGFSAEDFAETEDGEIFLTDSGATRAEEYLNRVIVNGMLTEHGRDKLIKFFKFDEDMFTSEGEDSYAIIAKAKTHAMRALSLSEKDFTSYEHNFVVNEKARVASFLELGVKNAKELFGFTDADFTKKAAGEDYLLSPSGKDRLTKIFRLSPKDFVPEGEDFYISRQSIVRIKELFAREIIIDEREGTLRFTTLGAYNLKRLFGLTDDDFVIDEENCTASLTKAGYKKVAGEYALLDRYFTPTADSEYFAVSEVGIDFFSRYTELSASSFSAPTRLGDYPFSEDGVREIKRVFSLSDEDLLVTQKSAFLTLYGAKKLEEAFDISLRGLVTIDKKSGYYSFSKGEAESLCERLSIDSTGFAGNVAFNGLFMLEGTVDKLKREITLVENADYVFMPKTALLTKAGKERLTAAFALNANELIAKGDEYLIPKSQYGIFKRIMSLDELYSPLILTKGGLDKLSAVINFDYIVNEKRRTATLTKIGIGKVEKYFEITNLALPENGEILHHVNTAIRAYGTMTRDVHYIVKSGAVYIVDQSTGRVLPGRRFSEGLHQAIEAKERLEVQRESKTTATISYQNFFRMYRKLSGMTGTALTEDEEFKEIYSLDVVEVPTNKPVIRQDHNDMIFRTRRGKLNAILSQIISCYKKGQPVLVGTTSVEKSEELSRLLKREKIPHSVLNAKEHKNEAAIIAEAGTPGAVTIATNMAGRGTDIMLGGNPEIFAKLKLKKLVFTEKKYTSKGNAYASALVENADGSYETDDEDLLEVRALYRRLLEEAKAEVLPKAQAVREAGGLFVIGSERHDSRRIDNQLRGRSGRQGDPGESRFYISFEDDLMRLFGATRFDGVFSKIGMDENMPIEMGFMTGQIERAQKRVESNHFSARKNVLSYDDVMNEQRKVVYETRRELLFGDDINDAIRTLIERSVGESFDECFAEGGEKTPRDFPSLFSGVLCEGDPNGFSDEEIAALNLSELRAQYIEKALALYDKKLASLDTFKVATVAEIPEENEELKSRIASLPVRAFEEFERTVYIRNIDKAWIDHLEQMEDLKSYVGLNSYAQRNPITAYQIEGAAMFSAMTKTVRYNTASAILRFIPSPNMLTRSLCAQTLNAELLGFKPKESKAKVSKNAPCPCGSGKKYKHCCYEKDMAEGDN